MTLGRKSEESPFFSDFRLLRTFFWGRCLHPLFSICLRHNSKNIFFRVRVVAVTRPYFLCSIFLSLYVNTFIVVFPLFGGKKVSKSTTGTPQQSDNSTSRS
jgi:hypothetical protein